MRQKILWIVFATLAILVGLYPNLYFIVDRKFGLLSTKDAALLNNTLWNVAFYTHIILGGIALLIGWTQFSVQLRAKYLNLHRNIGKIYVLSGLLSACAGFFIAFYATGGIIASLGFLCLAIIWFSTTLKAYFDIRHKNIIRHQKMMIFSYAACFAAVMLRIWLPLLTVLLHDFTPAYQIVAWLCWIPNVLVAYFIVRKI